MPWLSLLMKDLREHGLALFGLATAYILVLLLAIAQQRAGAFNMSGFAVVRFSLITIVPLIIFILGNRLIVREYVGNTRKFVEALPVRTPTQLVVKFLLGLFYCIALVLLVVLIAAAVADRAENINSRYVQLVLIKAVAIAVLYWCVVFFVSFTGRIRLVIYVVMALTLMYVINKPSLDQTAFPPIALMEQQLFVFERDFIPWKELALTGLISVCFVVAGFVLALINDGSVAEQLGKPLTRREFATYALLGLGFMTVYGTLEKNWSVESYTLGGEYVLRDESTNVGISFLDEANRDQASKILKDLSDTIDQLRADVGISDLPLVQVALNTELEITEIEPQLSDGVLVTANYLEYDEFEFSLLESIAIHHLLLRLTNGRWDFESRHWLLDGLARWWAEGSSTARDSDNVNELFALALVIEKRLDDSTNILLNWQTITDQYGFEAADALSFSAVLYLQELAGTEAVIELASDYINEDVGSSSVESVASLLDGDVLRFKRISNIPIDDFHRNWRAWLRQQLSVPDIAELVNSVPDISGSIRVVENERGGFALEGSYSTISGDDVRAEAIQGTCVLRHQVTSAYDLETMIYEKQRDRQPCVTDQVVHRVYTPYASGDRSYVLLEYEAEMFHRPIPLLVERVHIK